MTAARERRTSIAAGRRASPALFDADAEGECADAVAAPPPALDEGCAVADAGGRESVVVSRTDVADAEAEPEGIARVAFAGIVRVWLTGAPGTEYVPAWSVSWRRRPAWRCVTTHQSC